MSVVTDGWFNGGSKDMDGGQWRCRVVLHHVLSEEG